MNSSVPLSRNYGLHATRAWVANRTVHVALDNGRVVGLPARQHHVLATLTDDQLATAAIRSHQSGDAIEWRTGPGEFDRFSLAVWDVVEGTPRAVRAWVDGRTVLFELADGRVFGFPAANFGRLRKASDGELAGVEVQADGYGLRWDDPVDEDISVPGVVAGRVQGP
jgi:hypothetical protein